MTLLDLLLPATFLAGGLLAIEQFLLKHEFIKRLHRCYGDEGIKVA